jgi:type IX secretion system substrate protein
MTRPACILIFCFVTATALNAQSEIALTIADTHGYPTVILPFRLIEDGKLVTSPDVSRIRFLENSTELPFTIQCPEQMRSSASVAIGLERSLDNNFGLARQAALDFLAKMNFTDVANNASYWSFSTFITREVDVVRDSARLANVIAATSVAQFPFNGTPLFETMHRAIEDIVQYGTEPNRAIVFVTDGVNNTANSSKSADDVIGRAVVDRVRVYVIAIGNKTGGQTEMRRICDNTGGLFFHVSDPNAYDSIYESILTEPQNEYWCALEFDSPLCANGSSRVLTVEYTDSQGSVIGENLGYTAPLLPSLLSELLFWESPKQVMVQQGDTIQCAFGASLSNATLVSDLSLFIEHPGLRSIALAEPLDAAQSWIIDTQPGSSFTTVGITPSAAELLGAGNHRWFRLTFIAEESGPVEFSSMLLSDATECLSLQAHELQRNFTISLDTVLTSRGAIVDLSLKNNGAAIPEGIQSIHCEVQYDLSHMETGLSEAVVSNIAAGWYISQSDVSSQGTLGTIALNLRGPAIDSVAKLFSIRFMLLPDASYFNPVSFRSFELNDFGLNTTVEGKDGLIVIRDSCRNNIQLVQSGLAVSTAAPNPARSSVGFFISAPDARSVYAEVYNALGKSTGITLEAQATPEKSLIAIPVSQLESGQYFIHFHSRGERVIQRFAIAR